MVEEASRSLGGGYDYPTWRYLSRNETLGQYKATDEEFLLEIVDHLKIHLVEDLNKFHDRGADFDYLISCEAYNSALDKEANRFKNVNGGYRKMTLVPSFMLALVMMSRVRHHFIHADWFRTSALLKMLDVHGRVRASLYIKYTC